MKKIIKGKKYNTETAKLIGYNSNNLSQSDFNYVCVSLYLKKTGEYFLHGEGHGNSIYGEKKFGGGLGWGETITPISVIEAQEWAEKFLDGDEYEKIFGEIQE